MSAQKCASPRQLKIGEHTRSTKDVTTINKMGRFRRIIEIVIFAADVAAAGGLDYQRHESIGSRCGANSREIGRSISIKVVVGVIFILCSSCIEVLNIVVGVQ